MSERTRRDLLRAAGGAFTLAASGLLLPTWGDEAEARPGKKKRRHRRRRQNSQQQAPNGAPQGDPFQILGVALYVHNLRSTAIGVREFVLIGTDSGTTWQNKRDWQVIDAKPATGPEHFVDYVEENLQVVAELTSGHIIWAGNPPLGFPWVTIGEGNWGKNGWQNKRATLLDKSFSVNTRYVVPGFTAERLGDTDSHKQFLINLV